MYTELGAGAGGGGGRWAVPRRSGAAEPHKGALRAGPTLESAPGLVRPGLRVCQEDGVALP